jgi:hypothetical protein
MTESRPADIAREQQIMDLKQEVLGLQGALDELNQKKNTEAKEPKTETDPADNAREEQIRDL